MSADRILVVDDDADIVALLRDVLGDEGYVVDAAATAEEALSLIRENIYEAALVDFNLPDMDGIMLHRQIRQMDDDLANRTIFMSGLIQSDSSLGYYASYGEGFLSKPFEARDVVNWVKRVLER